MESGGLHFYMYADKDFYRAAWGKAYTEDPPVPLNVDLELASVCNLECPFCFYADKNWDAFIREKGTDGKPRARFMPTELALRIIDQAAELGVPALKMNWRGESTLHPGYQSILEYAGLHSYYGPNPKPTFATTAPEGMQGFDLKSPRFHDILVNTNANCPDSAIIGLMYATKVMVSLDSLVPETYAKMRVGGKLERAKEVIKEIIRRRHPNLWVRRVLTKDNLDEPFARMVRDEFGDYPHISEHYCKDRNEASKHQVECVHDSRRTYCGYPSQRVVVASSGLCYPCCVDLAEEMPIGDVKTQSLKEIWESHQVKALRSELRAGNLKSKACQNCTSWMSYDAPQRQYVQDVEVKA